MGMKYHFKIQKGVGLGAVDLGIKNGVSPRYDTKAEAQAEFDKLSKAAQKNHQIVEVGEQVNEHS